MRTLEIFKAGNHVSANGEALEFTESDLVASAAAYDPSKHEAPIVIGHPKHDDRAYGWVQSVDVINGSFLANPKQVDPDFAEAVRAGKFKKISASFYAPNSPSNPVQGVFYLRHVGFLGAMPPSVKGMAPVNFNEQEEGVVNFSEIDFMDWDDMTNAMLWANLRDFFIGKFGLEIADKTIPANLIDELKISAAMPEDDEPMQTQEYTELNNASASNAQAEALSAKEAALSAKEAELLSREAKLVRAEFSEYTDRLISDGKVLPREKPQIVAALVELKKLPQVIEFAEGDESKSVGLLDSYKASLENRPKQVDFAEISQGIDPIDFNDGDAIAQKATEHINTQKALGVSVSPIDAVNFVVGKK